ncbi:MAG: tRNA (guanosine(46)-N7)-methyltransferase TrmB [Planctomycetota bacterium]|nr:MAG: tRNA (guanosine(46)-N7)-methyltransferase TrmB [Planctomycetota bacterium]
MRTYDRQMMNAAGPKRIHRSGRLAFRAQVREAKRDDLPLLVAGDAPFAWSDLVPADAGEVEMEIGCGKGSFLVAAAQSRPETFFLGVEAGPAYASYCADRLARNGLSNAQMLSDDARLLLADSVPAGALSRLHVYYPDPWPKRRHRKRRLFDLEWPELSARALRIGGELLIATDNTRYFGEILAVMGSTSLFRRDSQREREYGDESPGLAFGPTNFAQKYLKEGRARHRAVYRCIAHPQDAQ